MSQDNGTAFRSKLFGGFNKSDVIDYISNASRSWCAEKEKLERQLAEADKRADALKSSNDLLTDYSARLKSEADQNAGRIAALEDRTAELSAAAREREARLTETAAALEEASSRAEAAAAARDALEQAHREDAAALDDLRGRSAALADEAAGLRARAEQAERRSAELEREAADLRARLAAFEAKKSDLDEKSRRIETLFQNIASVVGALGSDRSRDAEPPAGQDPDGQA